ncbi:hypothetical protein DSC45_04815 [Streptomyces sp. YIM 130001]|nr:hypothetical protein DSC45_04815 [Streptomyces sp. YIM 130001]
MPLRSGRSGNGQLTRVVCESPDLMAPLSAVLRPQIGALVSLDPRVRRRCPRPQKFPRPRAPCRPGGRRPLVGPARTPFVRDHVRPHRPVPPPAAHRRILVVACPVPRAPCPEFPYAAGVRPVRPVRPVRRVHRVRAARMARSTTAPARWWVAGSTCLSKRHSSAPWSDPTCSRALLGREFPSPSRGERATARPRRYSSTTRTGRNPRRLAHRTELPSRRSRPGELVTYAAAIGPNRDEATIRQARQVVPGFSGA